MPEPRYKDLFPVYTKHPRLVYLDSAASTLRPETVTKRLEQYARYEHANVHRGAYKLSYEATNLYDQARETVASFIHAPDKESVIFTYGTTDGLNMLMRSLSDAPNEAKRDKIVLSIYEHHSNIVPWQYMAQQQGLRIEYLYDFSEESLNKIDEHTRFVAVTLMSNATGLCPPVKSITKKARQMGALVIADAAQYIGHEPCHVVDLDVDYMVFSGHKMFGPTGIGVLYGKKELMEGLQPFRYGGDMIEYVYEQEATYAHLPNRLEAGTPNIEGVIGLMEAIHFIESIGITTIKEHVDALRREALQRLKALPYIEVVEPQPDSVEGVSVYGPVISFMMKGAHPHDISSILDVDEIAVRAGHHCAQPLMSHLHCQSTCRISFQLYNTVDDIDRLITQLEEARRWLVRES